MLARISSAMQLLRKRRTILAKCCDLIIHKFRLSSVVLAVHHSSRICEADKEQWSTAQGVWCDSDTSTNLTCCSGLLWFSGWDLFGWNQSPSLTWSCPFWTSTMCCGDLGTFSVSTASPLHPVPCEKHQLQLFCRVCVLLGKPSVWA